MQIISVTNLGYYATHDLSLFMPPHRGKSQIDFICKRKIMTWAFSSQLYDFFLIKDPPKYDKFPTYILHAAAKRWKLCEITRSWSAGSRLVGTFWLWLLPSFQIMMWKFDFCSIFFEGYLREKRHKVSRYGRKKFATINVWYLIFKILVLQYVFLSDLT